MNHICNLITHPGTWLTAITIGAAGTYWYQDEIEKRLSEKSEAFFYSKLKEIGASARKTPAIQNLCVQVQNITGKNCSHILNLVHHLLSPQVQNITEKNSSDILNVNNQPLSPPEQSNNDLFVDPKKELKEIGESFSRYATSSLRASFSEKMQQLASDALPLLTLGILALGASSIAGLYLYQKMKSKSNIEKLRMEIHERTLFTPFTQKLSLANPSPSQIQPFFAPECSRRIEEIFHIIKSAPQERRFLPNVLLYGPSGTGKTLLSDWIAKRSQINYIKISGNDLVAQIKNGSHLAQFNQLMEKMNPSWPANSKTPWVLIIDQADSLFKTRSPLLTNELEVLQNAFLKKVEKESGNCMVLLCAHRIEDWDPRVLSRMDHKIHLPLPEREERRRILKAHVETLFSQSERTSHFTDAKLGLIAKETAGFSGRTLAQLVHAIANKQSGSKEPLSERIIDQTLRDFLAQEQEIKQAIKI